MNRTTPRPSGTVDRAGGWLVVQPPPGMPAHSWSVIVQELVLFARAEERPQTTVAVPADAADALRRILAQPWPGSQWPWEWSSSAVLAADTSYDLSDALHRLLDPSRETDHHVEDVVRELASTDFDRTLLPAQAEAVASLLAAGSGGNFSVPGSGKTTMTLALFALLRARNLVDRLLVVAPLSAYEAWTIESEECFSTAAAPTLEVAPALPNRATDVVLVNYERIASGGTRASIDAWSHGRRLMVVFDEAHRAKRGADGWHGAGAIDVAKMAHARFVLTGTPMPNQRDDLAAILDLAWPGHGERLADPHTPFADRTWVRITKHDLHLKDPHIDIELVPLDPNHDTVYKALSGGLRGCVKTPADAPVVAAATTRLLAAATNPALLLADSSELAWPDHVAPPPDLGVLLRDPALSIRPAKLLRVAEYAAQHRARGEKLLIWTNFLGNVRELARMLAPWNPAVITGETPREDEGARTDRVRELARFRTDPTCTALIATPQTLGEGVSLHRACQSQIHLDRTFNAGLFLQAIDRTHRVGMPPGSVARVRVLVAEGTIDEVVHTRLRSKLRRMSEVLDDPTLRLLALPDPEKDVQERLEPAEVRDLLSHITTPADA